jgi:hypothetical protein
MGSRPFFISANQEKPIMASPQQIRANHANAQLSTGPNDTSRTRSNGMQHGMTSKQTVIRGESQVEYDQFQSTLIKELGPGSETERLLAERIVAAAWRLRRFSRMEAAFFNSRIDAYLEANPDHDPDAALANLFCDGAEAQHMRLFLRYQTAVQREYDTAVKQLDKARKERAQQEFQRAADVEALPPQVEDLQEEPVSIGFASYDGYATAATPSVQDRLGDLSAVA